MPSLTIQKQSALSPNEMFERISGLLSNDGDLRKLDPNFESQFDAANLSGTATGSMFKARMNVAADAGGSKVELVVDLPMTMTLMKGMIEKKLRAKVDEVLA